MTGIGNIDDMVSFCVVFCNRRNKIVIKLSFYAGKVSISSKRVIICTLKGGMSKIFPQAPTISNNAIIDVS